MAFQSPYRDPPKRPPGMAGEIVSRATMFVIGLALAYATMRAVGALTEATAYASHAATQQSYTSTFGRRRNGYLNSSVALLLMWASVVGLGIISGTVIAAAVLPVGTIQSLFERCYTPPVTGDRDPHDHLYRWWFGWGWWR